MPAFVVPRLTVALDQLQRKGINGSRILILGLTVALDQLQRKGITGSRILILGLPYKQNIDYFHESPALKLISLIEKRGAHVDYHDPHIPILPLTREYADVAGRISASFSAASIAGYDAVVIATDHNAVDYSVLVAIARLIVDTRNICRRTAFDGPHIVAA